MLIICSTVMLISCVYAVELVCDGACCLTATTPRFLSACVHSKHVV